ncbi:nitrogen fixation protein NifQ [Paraburkholderia sp. BCC1885]|uniref:nitrogen fixation protein NifQ n=1 Tax=Paraburkholderia sp. BCC1885 TaxID=2562669 RepID=UPI0028CBA326|nr:nitrogen fixation protein NifQ [Paraburkholderia sp. BCC1885]
MTSVAAAPARGFDQACAARVSQWMATAVDAGSFDTLLFAKLVAAREVRGEWALLGLSAVQWAGLMSRHFARVSALPGSTGGLTYGAGVASKLTLTPPQHVDFVSSLRALLLHYADPAVCPDDAQCLATIVAYACLRPDHLWRDLGLKGRDEVSAMLERYFPSLIRLNVENLRWKKFLARQLAVSLGEEPGPAPGCPGCEDYGFCFPSAS